mmetsp:Transcript_52226/g.154147  ORF Transcript_52226/g.154147 Transcript_52226/m.154147 type:complete len:288 (-) Transcript_52226:9-872(-)
MDGGGDVREAQGQVPRHLQHGGARPLLDRQDARARRRERRGHHAGGAGLRRLCHPARHLQDGGGRSGRHQRGPEPHDEGGGGGAVRAGPPGDAVLEGEGVHGGPDAQGLHAVGQGHRRRGDALLRAARREDHPGPAEDPPGRSGGPVWQRSEGQAVHAEDLHGGHRHLRPGLQAGPHQERAGGRRNDDAPGHRGATQARAVAHAAEGDGTSGGHLRRLPATLRRVDRRLDVRLAVDLRPGGDHQAGVRGGQVRPRRLAGCPEDLLTARPERGAARPQVLGFAPAPES